MKITSADVFTGGPEIMTDQRVYGQGGFSEKLRL